MTLIASVGNPGFLGLSDIAISCQTGIPGNVALPLHPDVRKFEFPSHAIAATAQKTILIDDTHAVMWCGSQVVAEFLIRELSAAKSQIDKGEFCTLIKESGLSSGELGRVSLISHHLDGRGQLHRQGHNTEITTVGPSRLFKAGSGTWDFFDSVSTKPERIQGDGRNAFYAEYFMRIGRALINEADGKQSLSFGYGGWFEMLMERSGALIKIPYLLKFWDWRDGVLIDLPAFQCWYDQRRLHVLTVDLRKPEAERLFLNIVDDPLQPSSSHRAANDWIPKQRPAIQFHALLSDSKWHLCILGGTDDYVMHVEDGIVFQDFTRTFVNMLERRARGEG